MKAALYHSHEIKEPQIKPLFQPKVYTWLITLVGLAGYLLGFVIFVFGATIALVKDLRDVYLNWAIASFIATALILLVSREIINRFGATVFRISEKSYSINSIFGSSKLIKKEDIATIKLEIPTRAMQILPLSTPKIKIITLDNIYTFRATIFQDHRELLSYFDSLSDELHDEFAEYYHKSRNSFYLIFLRMSQDTWGLIGLSIILIYVFMALWGAYVALITELYPTFSTLFFLRNPEYGNGGLPNYDWQTARHHPPNADFWFGTDFIGRDIFSRLVFGTTYTFMVALAGSFVSIILVVLLGYSTAVYGGLWDDIVMRIADTLLTYPPFIPLILVSAIATPLRTAVYGGYFLSVFLILSFITWPLGTRILRAEVLEIKQSEYYEAAEQLGASKYHLILRHVVPKTFPTILIIFSYAFTDVILGMTLLGFIGLGSESTLTWGSDLAKAVKFAGRVLDTWWTVVFPTLWIFVLVFGLTMFADSVRDTLDPTLRGGINSVPFEQRNMLEDSS